MKETIKKDDILLMLVSEIDICKELFDYATNLCAEATTPQEKRHAEELQAEYYIRYRQTQDILRCVQSYI